GEHTKSGFPIMANDPHRRHAIPSLRYWSRLHAPGWNVIGAGEPVIPGISIGHNDFGAWGLTIFETDNEDLRIYDINPDNPLQYQFKGEWLDMRIIKDTISVKGQESVIVDHYYTHHGPVTFIDEGLNKAVAIQAAWLEVGGAPYLASLRMGQAENWEAFREACAYNHIPAENMVWADRDGNIGWQATGIAPIREGFSGLVALPGDGSKEWGGYLPILERPNSLNPSSGFIATANENVTDTNYSHPNSLGFEWADAFRGERIREVLSKGEKFSVEDMGALQNDYLSLPARRLTPYLLDLDFENLKVTAARNLFKDWDYILDQNSITAGIYVMWERMIRAEIFVLAVPEEARPYVGSVQMTRVLQWIEKDQIFGEGRRDRFLKECFEKAIIALEKKLGPELKDWQYGQEAYKKAHIRHPLSAAVREEYKEKLDVGPVPRGGYSFTPSANAYGDNNTSGASFRIIVDTSDWEETMGINTPGQSGDPDSDFYTHLFQKWANDEYFKASFEKKEVEDNAVEKVIYSPK
ncbi:MAG TPA: penicillin acylase family protein, partial [Anditalea sp.]|nr:penicillin acylase family protein [Anditalea sp.]